MFVFRVIMMLLFMFERTNISSSKTLTKIIINNYINGKEVMDRSYPDSAEAGGKYSCPTFGELKKLLYFY